MEFAGGKKRAFYDWQLRLKDEHSPDQVQSVNEVRDTVDNSSTGSTNKINCAHCNQTIGKSTCDFIFNCMSLEYMIRLHDHNLTLGGRAESMICHEHHAPYSSQNEYLKYKG